MITMRPTPSVVKVVKPPPPVPPRPSKIIVAEALAKTRSSAEKSAPLRSAPAPPPEGKTKTDALISRSQSNGSVNSVLLKKATIQHYERSISEEINGNSRPVVFHSNNIIKSNSTYKEKEVLRSDGVITEQNLPKTNNNSSIIHLGHDESIEDSDGYVTIDKVNIILDSLDQKDVPEKEPQSPKKDLDFLDSKLSKEELIDNDSRWDELLKDRNHVNTLIDEMFASVLEVSDANETNSQKSYDSTKIKVTHDDSSSSNNSSSTTSSGVDVKCATTVLVIESSNENSSSGSQSRSSTMDNNNKKKNRIDDKMNHEYLIAELQNMRMENDKIAKRQRLPSDNFESDSVNSIHWIEVCDGKEEKLSSCQINIVDCEDENRPKVDYERLNAMSSLHGLPPLPKSLSGFNLFEGLATNTPPTPLRTTSKRSVAHHQNHRVQATSGYHHTVYPSPSKMGNGTPPSDGGRKSGGASLDSQLEILRREMYSLRQLDLSLLSQLWSLNESIQDFRQMLQDQDDRVLSPPSPSPVPSSSGDEADTDHDFYLPPSTTAIVNTSTTPMPYRPAPPPPVRRPNHSSNISTG